MAGNRFQNRLLLNTVAAICLLSVAACGGSQDDITPPDDSRVSPTEKRVDPTIPVVPGEPANALAERPENLHMYKLDCGSIDISDLDDFDMGGAYAGQSDTFVNTCYLIRHPDGTLLWDLGLPGLLAAAGEQTQGIYTVSLDETLTEQLRTLGLSASDIDYFSLSHSHFDHIGQVDQIAGAGAVWIVHRAELAAMTPADDNPDPTFVQFGDFEQIIFDESHDVFGDGTVQIIEAPGHTPGHSVLFVDLPDTGPVILIGDLFHRIESIETRRVPRFNWDVVQAETLGIEPAAITRASMEKVDRLASERGARQILQHEPESVDDLPEFPVPAQ